MKKLLLVAASVTLLTACQDNKKNETEGDGTIMENPSDTITVEVDTIAAGNTSQKMIDGYAAFGNHVKAEKALTTAEMYKKYKGLKPGDTLDVKFKSKIKEVCQKKGCWMSLELPDGKESFVRFKDYGFFVPLNAGSQEAVVEGKAFVSEISVAELKHYAKDGGKSQSEIDAITEPKTTYGFQADGVLIAR